MSKQMKSNNKNAWMKKETLYLGVKDGILQYLLFVTMVSAIALALGLYEKTSSEELTENLIVILQFGLPLLLSGFLNMYALQLADKAYGTIIDLFGGVLPAKSQDSQDEKVKIDS